VESSPYPVSPSSYPVTFSVDYPDRKLNRLTSFFRIFTVIPIGIVFWALAPSGWGGGSADAAGGIAAATGAAGTGVLFLPVLLMVLFRKKYPRWWYDWNLEILRFGNRIGVYLALMDDRYPSTDEQQAVHLDFPYPDVEADLERGMPLVKWLLAIPHYIVLFFLYIGAFFAIVFAWFAILFTGRYPRGLFNYVEGVSRWYNRVIGYAFTLVTDRYPPFRLKP
jgi:fatty acid desaturase